MELHHRLKISRRTVGNLTKTVATDKQEHERGETENSLPWGPSDSKCFSPSALTADLYRKSPKEITASRRIQLIFSVTSRNEILNFQRD